jgi:hypothetical protein
LCCTGTVAMFTGIERFRSDWYNKRVTEDQRMRAWRRLDRG